MEDNDIHLLQSMFPDIDSLLIKLSLYQANGNIEIAADFLLTNNISFPKNYNKSNDNIKIKKLNK